MRKIEEIEKQCEERMKKALEATVSDLAGIRTGRASPALVEKIEVDVYGGKYTIQELAAISVPEPRLLLISPWDKSTISAIEKAILKSPLGLTPSNDGNVIKIPFPPLSEERRKDILKIVAKRIEEGKVAVRNIRRMANEELEELEERGEASEDEVFRAKERIQKLTDKYIELLNETQRAKEKEILEI